MPRPAVLSRPFSLFAGLLLAASCLLPAAASADAPAATPSNDTAAPTPSAEDQRIEAILRSFHPKQGKITLKDGIADLNLPDQFRYLDATDSRKLLVDIWHNPPEVVSDVIGMIIPDKFGEDEEHLWGATVSFSDAGYIKDEEPNYDELLKQVKENQEQANAAREKEGYPPLHIIGWAQAPHYDRDTKKLYWAKELQSGTQPQHGLNYDIRILGRRGALELSILASMDQLVQINNIVPSLLATVEFNQGHRYADFDPKTDKVAPYALAGLIGGGLLLAKAGGFKVILTALAAGWKLVAAGLVAVGAFFRRMFGGGTKVNTDKPGPPTGMA